LKCHNLNMEDMKFSTLSSIKEISKSNFYHLFFIFILLFKCFWPNRLCLIYYQYIKKKKLFLFLKNFEIDFKCSQHSFVLGVFLISKIKLNLCILYCGVRFFVEQRKRREIIKQLKVDNSQRWTISVQWTRVKCFFFYTFDELV